MVKQSIINAVQRVIAIERKLSQHNLEAAAAGSVTLPTGGHRVVWLKPTPLPNAEPPAIRYPVECLSPGLRKVVEAMAKKTQAPEAIAAQSVLAVVSLAFASRAKVQTLGSFSNAACFFVLIALSGERKSATDGWAMGGVNRTVLELRAEHAQLLRDYEQAVETIERGGEKPPRPVCPNFLVTEPTVEGAFKAILLISTRK